MDKRTSERMGRLAARVVKTGICNKAEAKRLAGCVLSQALGKPKAPAKVATKKAAAAKRRR